MKSTRKTFSFLPLTRSGVDVIYLYVFSSSPFPLVTAAGKEIFSIASFLEKLSKRTSVQIHINMCKQHLHIEFKLLIFDRKLACSENFDRKFLLASAFSKSLTFQMSLFLPSIEPFEKVAVAALRYQF